MGDKIFTIFAFMFSCKNFLMVRRITPFVAWCVLEKILIEKKYLLNQEKLQLAATKGKFSSERQVDFL